jgi:hypothetical protein
VSTSTKTETTASKTPPAVTDLLPKDSNVNAIFKITDNLYWALSNPVEQPRTYLVDTEKNSTTLLDSGNPYDGKSYTVQLESHPFRNFDRVIVTTDSYDGVVEAGYIIATDGRGFLGSYEWFGDAINIYSQTGNVQGKQMAQFNLIHNADQNPKTSDSGPDNRCTRVNGTLKETIDAAYLIANQKANRIEFKIPHVTDCVSHATAIGAEYHNADLGHVEYDYQASAFSFNLPWGAPVYFDFTSATSVHSVDSVKEYPLK